VDKVEVAGGVPKPELRRSTDFVLNKGVGPALLGKASFTVTYAQ